MCSGMLLIPRCVLLTIVLTSVVPVAPEHEIPNAEFSPDINFPQYEHTHQNVADAQTRIGYDERTFVAGVPYSLPATVTISKHTTEMNRSPIISITHDNFEDVEHNPVDESKTEVKLDNNQLNTSKLNDNSSSNGRSSKEKNPITQKSVEVQPEDAQGGREARVLAYRTSTSRTFIASSTVAALSTCVSAVNPTPCVGRRRRRALLHRPLLSKENASGLSSSLADVSEEGTSDAESGQRDPKVIFTVWTTGFTTVTVITTSFYQGVTVTVSLACDPGNVDTTCFG